MKSVSPIDESSAPRSTRKLPPDYSTRRVQYRLLVIVALLMGMLFMFQWIWTMVVTPQPPVPVTVSSDQAGAEPRSFGRDDVEPGDIRGDALGQARSDLWNQILDRLTPEEEILMLRTLRSIRQETPGSARIRRGPPGARGGRSWTTMLDRYIIPVFG